MADNLLEVDLFVAGAAPEGRPRVAGRFVVPPGVTVLRGPSGAGKSSCLAAIAGLLRPTRGRITLGDRVLFDAGLGIDLPPERRQVGLVFQSLALFPHLSAARNVTYAVPRRLPAARRRDLAATWLARMRVDHLADRRPSTLSGGEAQRVALARALAAEPQALLLDEPFSALDDALRHGLRRELFAVIHELALPTILVTHDASDLEREVDIPGLETALPQLVLCAGRFRESPELEWGPVTLPPRRHTPTGDHSTRELDRPCS